MNNINSEFVVDYIQGLYKDNKKSLFIEELRTYGEENRVPIIHREVAELLKTIIKIYKPKKILEIGTAIGYSSIFFMHYCPEDAQIVSLEKSEEMFNEACKNIKKYGYDKQIKVILGDALDSLEEIDDKYDMVFIDAAKGQYLNFYEKVKPLLADRALIVSDNILYKGMVASDDLLVKRKKTLVNRIRQYLDVLLKEPDLSTSIVPVGDGLAISYKEDK